LNFLITNDDGIWAPGLKALASALVEVGKVWILAPDRERSATGHAITVHKPLRPEKVKLGIGEQAAWHLNGTPADCVKLALEVLLPQTPCWVCSGINHGSNLGTDVLYSGTVSAAVEGTIYNIPSLAISLVDGASDFSHAASIARDFLQDLKEHSLGEPTLININVPAGRPKESRVTTLGVRRYCNVFQKRMDPRGKEYFWMAGERVDCTDDPKSDIVAVAEGKISITPLTFKLTDQAMRQKLKDRGW
jgi:5'-nucleotidase